MRYDPYCLLRSVEFEQPSYERYLLNSDSDKIWVVTPIINLTISCSTLLYHIKACFLFTLAQIVWVQHEPSSTRWKVSNRSGAWPSCLFSNRVCVATHIYAVTQGPDSCNVLNEWHIHHASAKQNYFLSTYKFLGLH